MTPALFSQPYLKATRIALRFGTNITFTNKRANYFWTKRFCLLSRDQALLSDRQQHGCRRKVRHTRLIS